MGTEQDRPISRLSRVARSLVQALSLSLIAASGSAQTSALLHGTPADCSAEDMQISGTATVAAMIDPSGKEIEARAIRGHALLRPTAEQAMLHWNLGSAPKPEETNIHIQFKVRGEGTR